MEYERANTSPGPSGELGIAAQSTAWFFSVPDAAAGGVMVDGRFDGRLGYSPNGWLSLGLQGGIVRGYSTGRSMGDGWKGDYYSADAYPYLKVSSPVGSVRLAAKVAVGYSLTLMQHGYPSVHDRFPNAYVDLLAGFGKEEHSTVVVRIGGTPFLGLGLGYTFHVGGLSFAGMVSGIPYIVGGHIGLHVGVAYGAY